MSGIDAELLDLFRGEAKTHAEALEKGLLALDTGRATPEVLQPLMRAAHSIKGAARIVGLDGAVGLAHAMEDVFVAAQKAKLAVTPAIVDRLLAGVDLYSRLGSLETGRIAAWLEEHAGEMAALAAEFQQILAAPAAPVAPVAPAAPVPSAAAPPRDVPPALAVVEPRAPAAEQKSAEAPAPASAVLVTAETVERLTALSGECLVQARHAPEHARRLVGVKGSLTRLARLAEGAQASPAELARGLEEARDAVSEALDLFERDAHRSEELASRLHDEAVAARMRPFADGTKGFPRLVRDTARELGKSALLEVLGAATRVDREVLALLEAPLGHLLRNAVDHGVEPPEERRAAGKSEEGRIVLGAEHRAGMLAVWVADDGRGFDVARIREKVVERGLAPAHVAAKMTDAELLDFLFLPGFSTAGSVTRISGRGVGLDVVQTFVQEVRGSIRVGSRPGQGSRFELLLPLTLSVVRALVVSIAGEPYAIPLARVDRVLDVESSRLRSVEGRLYVDVDGNAVGLVPASQPLGLSQAISSSELLHVVVVSDRLNRFGLAVDALVGEQELVLRTLDPRLGKVPDLLAAAVLPDGAPLLVLDVDDLVRSIDNLLTGPGVASVRRSAAPARAVRRVLVVDDSITVREVERRLLENRGYAVDVAVDGMDGFNRVRGGGYDLVLTDVDMPRLNGVEMIRKIRKEPALAALPIVIVSYKDREEDRLRGLEAGASHYLTKGSFQDETLLTAVADLIGEP